MKKFRFLFLLLIVGVVLQACGSTPTSQPTNLPTNPSSVTVTETSAVETPEAFASIFLKSGYGYRLPWLEVYFNNPFSPSAANKNGGMDGPVSAGIVAAKKSVDVALNVLSSATITKALIRAHQRGVAVRVVMESDNVTDRPYPTQLKGAGIPIVEDPIDGTMNNNFFVIDGNQVWTGSLNFTDAGLFKENNTYVRIFSNEVAQDYTREFEEMFDNNQFGENVVGDTPYPVVDVRGNKVEVMFSPDDGIEVHLIDLLNQATESIYFMALSVTSENIGLAIREKASQGVKVAGVVESSFVDPTQPSEYGLFRQAGIDVRLDGIASLMNNEVIIIDGSIVAVGSYDFNNKAETINDENMLFIYSKVVAQKFMEEFQRVQDQAQK